MPSYKALYGRRCISPVGWFEVGETKLYGPDLIHQAIEKVKVIREQLMTTQSRQKSYSDVRRRDLEFEVVPIKDVQVTEDISYEEVPVAILDRRVHKLRTKDVDSVKVLWRNKNTEEITLEAEEGMKSKYPYMFQIEDNEDAGGTQDALEGEMAL
ncbi:uncharacterized protein [Nicotiana tomentosiformis]|uniref:uncharacterized protein n=1 Tax=Nicotiana tomentosiformis TaxID=4098 RepID=UPI00388C9061